MTLTSLCLMSVRLEESLRVLLRRDSRVRPICLPTARCQGGAGAACFDGRTAAVAGWGVLQERTKDYPTVLQEVQLPVLTSAACRDSQPEVITDDMLCTSYEHGGRDACQASGVTMGQGLDPRQRVVSRL